MKRFFRGSGVALAMMVLAISSQAEASAESVQEGSIAAASQVKYKSGKELRFDELLIQGQMKRAEISVVTGDAAEISDGLLRLRENFLDHASADLGEEILP